VRVVVSMAVRLRPMIVVVFMSMDVPMVIGMAVRPTAVAVIVNMGFVGDARLTASANAAHHTTSISRIFISSPCVICTL